MQDANTDQLTVRFFDLSLEYLCIFDASGVIQTANAALANTLGVTSDHLAGCLFHDAVLPRDQAHTIPPLDKLQSSRIPQSFVCQIRGHSEVTRWCMWTIYPHVSEVFHAIGKDITPFKEMEDKENERNIFAEALLDTVLAINSSLSLDQVLNRILSNVRKVVAYDHVHLMLVEADEVEVVGEQRGDLAAADTPHASNHRFRMLDSHYLQTMFETKESLIVSQIHDAPIWMTPPTVAQSGSFLGAPIVVEDEVIGFLAVIT
ncbi:MAG: GAF domain-containing protein, partial [Chloroflexota bacterium]